MCKPPAPPPTPSNTLGEGAGEGEGGVRVAGQLDRETTSQYQLKVMAEDRGSPPRYSTATLVINVEGMFLKSKSTNQFTSVFTLLFKIKRLI